MGHTIAMTDAELLEASRRGERAAFGALVERYQNVVSAVSYSRTRDQALSEDVAQETFLAAWRQLDQLREPGRLRWWLCGIARNLARKARRRTDREQPIEAPQVVAGENPFDAVCEAQAERVVGDALARVPETYRDVLVLYYREQRSAREVADTLGLTEAAVLQRLARGRQYLADGLSSLVERSLRNQRVRRNLVAGVVAALPVIVPSRVEASPGSHGGHMWKIALAAAALTGAGITAYIARSGADAPPPQTRSESRTARAVIPPPPAVVPPARAAAPALPSTPERPVPRLAPAPSINTAPLVDRALSEQLGLERGPSRGPTGAPITVVMFNDLQCHFCMAAEASIDQLMDEYPNQLRLVMKQMPVHRTAALAAEAALAADAQGKFWELHEQMLAHNEDLSRDALLGLARDAGLDVARLRDALDAHTYADAVAADLNAASALEFFGTPAFVINGRKVSGNLPIAQLRKLIDAVLAERR